MVEHTRPESAGAYFHDNAQAVLIEHVLVHDADVAREARHWTSGARGPSVEDPDQLDAADLEAFVIEAVKIGAHALAATGQAVESRALEQVVRELGEKAAQSSNAAAEVTEQSAANAAKTVSRAAEDAKKAITEAEKSGRREFATAVTTAKEELNAELRRLFGGDNPELLDRIAPVLAKFGSELDAKVGSSVDELFKTAVKQFDLDDPTSPMAKHAAGLERRHEQLAKHLQQQHTELTGKFDELTRELQVRAAEQRVASLTPIKGDTYAEPLHAMLTELATGLGDEYTDTSRTTGRISKSRKGDGLLVVGGGSARVVVEMSDSPRTTWNDYLDEAERNHGAQASLGLVRAKERNGGHAVRAITPRRIVLAFDPETDDPDLLRVVVQLLRTGALAANSRSDAAQITTAEEKISEAIVQLGGIDTIKKSASGIYKQAQSIENQCNTINSGIERLLNAALAALTAAGADGAASTPGAAA
ncbi:Fis family transcriptional regulator [Nocardia sp. NPDC004415]